MKVFINHSSVEVQEGISLAGVLRQEGIAADGIAVAIDNRVVPRSRWEETLLQPEAKITVIQAVCGG